MRRRNILLFVPTILLGMVVDWKGAEAGLIAAAVLVGGVGLLFARFAPEQWRRGG